MSENGGDHSRRDVLRATAALGAVGAASGLSGCSTVRDSVEDGLGLGGDDLGHVPEDADSATYLDVNAVLDDEATERLANAYLEQAAESEYYEGPESYAEAREEFEDETELDPAEANFSVGFSEYSGRDVTSDYGGTLLDGGWSEEAVVEALEDGNDTTYEPDEYEGKTVYEPEREFQPTIGVVADGLYVTATNPEVVEDVIDIEVGDGETIDETLRQGYERTRNAPIRYVGEMPPWLDGDSRMGEEGEVDLDPFQDTEYVAGSVYRDGDTRGTETTIRAEDESTARDVEDVLDGYVSVLRADENTSEELATILDDTTVERDGRDVVVRYEATVDELEDLLEGAMEGAGRSSEIESNVQAGVSVQKSGEEVAVTWTSNQNADYVVATVDGCEGFRKRIDAVGDTVAFTGCSDGVDVTVIAYTEDGDSTVIVQRSF